MYYDDDFQKQQKFLKEVYLKQMASIKETEVDRMISAIHYLHFKCIENEQYALCKEWSLNLKERDHIKEINKIPMLGEFPGATRWYDKKTHRMYQKITVDTFRERDNYEEIMQYVDFCMKNPEQMRIALGVHIPNRFSKKKDKEDFVNHIRELFGAPVEECIEEKTLVFEVSHQIIYSVGRDDPEGCLGYMGFE